MASTILSRILKKRYLIIPSTSHCFSVIPNTKYNVWYSTKKSTTNVELSETDNKKQISIAEVVKENFKFAGHLGIIISGIGMTAFILYTLFLELFSSESPDAIYSKARKRCMEHPKLIDLLGAPIKAYVDETNRRRRRHINHMYYRKNGVKYMRLKFYLEGTRRRGTAFLEVKKNESDKFEYSYLYVNVNVFGIIVLEPEQNVDI
ncbi:mitochondrial import inner membrane translocase subunit Tim21 [Anoplolepis gracilipes]|uniref:mitochondrial import inner membrane translocase subunit Tim21 n=1 Tax=Anoplolepis gracilipes TaxID=354296 RepID=UPI003BA0932C